MRGGGEIAPFSGSSNLGVSCFLRGGFGGLDCGDDDGENVRCTSLLYLIGSPLLPMLDWAIDFLTLGKPPLEDLRSCPAAPLETPALLPAIHLHQDYAQLVGLCHD